MSQRNGPDVSEDDEEAQGLLGARKIGKGTKEEPELLEMAKLLSRTAVRTSASKRDGEPDELLEIAKRVSRAAAKVSKSRPFGESKSSRVGSSFWFLLFTLLLIAAGISVAFRFGLWTFMDSYSPTGAETANSSEITQRPHQDSATLSKTDIRPTTLKLDDEKKATTLKPAAKKTTTTTKSAADKKKCHNSCKNINAKNLKAKCKQEKCKECEACARGIPGR